MKNILITGASGGIGTAIAKSFNTKENNLILIYNQNKPQIKESSNVVWFQCDLTKTEQVKQLVDKIIKQYKKIDVLINCAGVSEFALIQDTTDESFYRIVDNNIKSTVSITSIVSKYMISEKFGKIVNISSIWGVVGASMESLYSLSKGAINTLTLSLAKELGPSNINVNAVCPGLIETKMNNNLTNETINEIISSTPIRRIGKPEDVANLVKFLCSEEASFITGQIITIDGGLTL